MSPEAILAGDLRSIARAATAIENRTAEGAALLAALKPHARNALVVGVTGAPGAGKSTLLDQLVAQARAESKTVAVLAVDPSSPISHGAILGDRIRLQRHSGDPGVFIRSVATRGALGGVAGATADLITLLDAAGRDLIFVETVGVGQSETEIAGLADVTVVVLVPSMGDDIQALKAGLLEVASLFLINKADLPGADQLARELDQMQSLSPAAPKPILRTVARDGSGVAELLAALPSLPRRPRHEATPIRLRLTNYSCVVKALQARGVPLTQSLDGRAHLRLENVLLELIKEQESSSF